MQSSTICYGAIVPPGGFRWIYKEEDGQWSLSDPPSHWPETDYRAAAFYEDHTPGPELTDKFHVAVSVMDCLKVHQALETEFGRMICEPDLYLKIASTRPAPSAILALANTYGLLRYRKSVITIERANSLDIADAFPCDPIEGERLSLYIEPARAWLLTYESINFNLRTWAQYQATEDIDGMRSFLEDGYNYAMSGSLTYQAKIDRNTGHAYSEIIASSLESMLDVQWGMSVAANATHRQCAECLTWFIVYPGAGRPEKRYCSDACRMRAYRKRKSQRSP